MLIFLVALAPVSALVIYFYHKDKYEKEPIRLLAKAFFGGFAITILAIIVELFLMVAFGQIKLFLLCVFLKVFLIAGLIEESCKFYVFRRLIYGNKEFNEPYDGIIYAVMISLGFAALENLIYVTFSFMKSGLAGLINVGILRAIFTVPAHTCWGTIMGYYLGLAKFTNVKKMEQKYISRGWLMSILAHGVYDFCIFVNTTFGLAYMAIIFIFSWKFVLEKVKIQVEKSPFKE